jgi:hypothetical protein
MTGDNTPATRFEISPAAAIHAEIGLAALRAGDLPHAIGALSSIDETSWRALNARFPGWLAASAPSTSTPDPLDATEVA